MASPLTASDPSQAAAGAAFSIDSFLEQERAKDILRFSTAGSVDDGKSTLIGRLLYDTQSVYDDQVRAIQAKGTTGREQLDFALLTDGLRAEREQGITIDVAYRYFSTARRKFIIADTPGHEQYTRNMATGASTADAAIVLVDARKGVLVQSRRHAYITALLGVRHVIVAVNKMDLVGYDERVFALIRDDFAMFVKDAAAEIGHLPSLHYLPVSALLGVNVVQRSQETPWYEGASLLELLESLPAASYDEAAAFRFPVQRVHRPNHQFRGFAGQIASGSVRVGDSVMVLPSRQTSRVQRIVTYDGNLPTAHAPLSVTLTLEDELDISRGDLLVPTGDEVVETRRFEAALVWMDAQPLEPARRYLLKHTSQTLPAQVSLRHSVQLEGAPNSATDTLEMNGIGVAEIATRRPIAVARYGDNRTIGAFVLIDAETNATVAAGMIRNALAEEAEVANTEPVTAEERARRWGHVGAILRLAAPAALIHALERALLLQGAFVVRGDASDPAFHARLVAAGALVLVAEDVDGPEVMLQIDGSHPEVVVSDASTIVTKLLDTLRSRHVLREEAGR